MDAIGSSQLTDANLERPFLNLAPAPTSFKNEAEIKAVIRTLA